MKFLNKLERRFGKYAINDLTKFILAGYAVGYIVQLLNKDLYGYLLMNPRLVLQGQVWRLFTWVITPPQKFSFFVIFMFLFFYFIGSSLERTWGAFRYNLYIFSGILFMTIGAMVTYGILYAINAKYAASVPIEITTYYINLTSFLAFALCYPDMQVMFMFIIPIKVKWLAIVDLVLIGYEFLALNMYYDDEYLVLYSRTQIDMFVWSQRALMLIPLLNFLIFFLCTRNYQRLSPKEMRRKTAYKHAVNSGMNSDNSNITKHRCAICGRTEKDGENLVFRFCSKCNGNYEYCEDHIFTHEHIK